MQLTAWANFFAAEVGASASLVGLVTVAISINLRRILEVDHLPGRAAESLLSLTAAFVVCSVALIPNISAGALGAVALALATMSFVSGVRSQLAWRRRIGREETGRQLVGAALRLVSAAPTGAGGLLLCLQSPAGVTWIAAGAIATLACAVVNAWVLLVEIIR